MNSRPFEETDLPEIAAWFAQMEWPLPPSSDILPKIGCVVESESGKHACGWLYTTDSSLAFLSWIGTNPQDSQEVQDKAFEALVLAIKKTIEAVPEINTLMILTRSWDMTLKMKMLGFKMKTGMNLCTWIK